MLPESNRKPYDMYEVIRRIVDDGVWFDMKPQFAKTIITCFARIGGGRWGSSPTSPSSSAASSTTTPPTRPRASSTCATPSGSRCCSFQDVPGFMVGTKVEQAGIIRHGAKMLYAVSRATVPKVTVVVRKAYGAGYYVMCGKAYEPDLIVAWPTAEISVMGAEGAVNIIMRRQIEEADDPDAKRAELVDGFPQDHRPLRRRRQRDDRRRHRSPRDAGCARAGDGGGQAGRAAVEEAWGDAGMRSAGAGGRGQGVISARASRSGRSLPERPRPGACSLPLARACAPLRIAASPVEQLRFESRPCPLRPAPCPPEAHELLRPRHHHELDQRRGRQPRPVPGDPVHARGVRRGGAARRRRGRVDDPHPRAHARRRAVVRDRGLPRSPRRSSARSTT